MTFYFYDLETSGINPRTGRIMQFAGQRTDVDLNPIGEPLVCLVALSSEVLPDPEAIIVHGVTPQKSIEEGYAEAEFLKIFNEHALQPGTIFTGFNTIRFDDEFMRYTLYRNFYDPYEWQWQDKRSRWDLLDTVRMTRALRPEGIQWPSDADGKPTNRLELLTKANGIEHSGAHDALADVVATIEVAKLIKNKQPKLFDYLVQIRLKNEASKLLSLDSPQPMVHSSGKLPSKYEKTSIIYPLASHPNNSNAVLCFDLRYDPEELSQLSIKQIQQRIYTPYRELEKKQLSPLPIKGVHLNQAPALAPLGVLDDAAWQRIGLDLKTIQCNLNKLLQLPELGITLQKAYANEGNFATADDADQQLYGGFMNDGDKESMRQVRNKLANELESFAPKFTDHRLQMLYPRYKARNFPRSLTADEKQQWLSYRQARLAGQVPQALGIEEYSKRVAKLAGRKQKTDPETAFLIEEMMLYGDSIMQVDHEDAD